MLPRAAALALAALLLVPALPSQASEASGVTRALQPVVVLGAQLPQFAVVANYVERPPAPMSEEEPGDGAYLPLPPVAGQAAGTPVDRLVVYKWDATTLAFARIPSQVDEKFARYLTNYASDFGIYSQADYEMTYAFDWEGKRKECEVAGDNLTASFCPGPVTTSDPVPGFDSDDEIVFMAGDAGAKAPVIPEGFVEVRAFDPASGATTYAYVAALASAAAPLAGYVSYAPDADADAYVQSNHGGYGGAPGGACHLGDGVDAPFAPVDWACAHRRPKDSAWVETDVYRFHYAGRWKLDGLQVKQADASWSDSLIDRWKGRAFQQKEGNAADIGGFEDENDWVKSSVTLGVRVGPVRVLRETWGADSGTSVTRLDMFYSSFFTQVFHMRVHPIPPDGVYAFWDNKASMVDTFYTPARPDGVRIDGVNDELYGTNSEWQQDVLGDAYFTIDAPDPTLQPPLASESWDEVEGPFGTLVTYVHTPSGAASGILTAYYRDDAAFLDGTGQEPGSFGAHGIHFFFTSDTDNMFLPAPVNEFVAQSTMFVLSGRAGNVGDTVAMLERVPLVVTTS